MVESSPPVGADLSADLLSDKVTPLKTTVQTKRMKPLFIGVVGGTASGKTSLCQRIEESLGEEVSLVSLDSFYKGLS